MKLKILAFPDKRLRIKAKKVAVVDTQIKTLINDMFETMYADNGVGLAATQVDKHLQIFVSDVGKEEKQPLCFINPEIISQEGELISEEGCLSVKGFEAKIKRATKVVVRALNENGEEFELKAEGFLAKCIQHETDHLQGIMFVDYLSKLKQKRLLDKIKKDKNL